MRLLKIHKLEEQNGKMIDFEEHKRVLRQEIITKTWIQRLKITQQHLYSPKQLEEIVFFTKDVSAHQESASSLLVIYNKKQHRVGLYHLASS